MPDYAPRREAMRRDGSDMDLPPGKTCADCAHFRRCNLIFGHIAADEACDWAPSRFLAQRKPADVAEVMLNAGVRGTSEGVKR